MLASVADAPRADPATLHLLGLLRNKAPAQQVRNFLRDDFDLAGRLLRVPATKHPQGFLTFKMGLSAQGDAALRFHVWMKNKREVGDQKGFQIHDHVFGFNSLLLCGQMENRSYMVKPSPTETGWRLFPVTYSAPNTDTIAAEPEPVALRRQQTEQMRAGDYYHMQAGVYHTSVVPRAVMTMTLLAAEAAPHMAFPRMIGRAAADKPQTNHRPPPDAADIEIIRHKLGRILAR